MSNPPTFRAYCKQLWESRPTTARHWARDQIVWPAIVTLSIAVITVMYNRKVDWQIVRAGLMLYAVAFVAYGLLQFIKAGWMLHREQEKTIADRDLYIQQLGEIMGRRAQEHATTANENGRNIERGNMLRRELDAARVAVINAKNEIEALMWPADRPKISFHAWGQRQLHFMPAGNNDPALTAQYGFYLANDGGAALEITVEVFEITQDLIAIGGTIPRIEGKTEGFVPIWIKNEVPLSRWCLDIALEKAWEAKVNSKEIYAGEALEFPISVVYRDYNLLWYRSRGTIIFKYNLLHANQISFGAVEQDKLGVTRPILRKEFYE
jgi:hypothetical protein